MSKLCLVVLLLSSSFLLAQDSNPNSMSQDNSKDSNSQVTVRGCVDRSGGDYVLIKQDPAMTYQLQATGKIKLRHYMGQRVEITGTQSATMSTSSDAMNRTGSASPVTLNISSIRTIDKECSAR